MKRTILSLSLTLALAVAVSAQEAPNIRSPNIDTGSPDGQLLADAGAAETIAERIPILEAALAQFPDSKYLGYILLQLQGAYVQQQDYAKAVETGNRLLEIVPEDLEVRHNINQSLVQLQQWDALDPLLVEARPIAEKVAGQAKPEDLDEDEEAIWQGRVDYAKGVVDWLEWATNTAMTQQADPQAKIAWLDRLVERYPDSDYSKGLESKYVMAYQQAGDQANMLAWMKKAVDAGVQDESYIYTLAEDAFNRQDNAAAAGYAEQTVALLEAKAPPEGMAPEAWEAHKAKLTAYAKFILGGIEVGKNTPNSYRAGRAHLLPVVDTIKAEGGIRYHIMAYYLGVCYVQLDIRGDNIQKAKFWMNEAASTEGPFKGQAQEALKKINAAI